MDPFAPAPLHVLLVRTALTYEEGRQGPRHSPYARSVVSHLSEAARDEVPELTPRASVGQMSFATIPWLALLDRRVTTTVTRGVYVVFLIEPSRPRVVLAMVNGAQDVCREHGYAEGRAILRRRGAALRTLLADHAERFEPPPIDLNSPLDLPRAYEAAYAFGRTYDARGIDPLRFRADLDAMRAAYADYAARVLPEAA